MAEIKLETKFVGEITGSFFVPAYQRGYRWGEEEVVRLLDDIYSVYDETTHEGRNYCLQPIVVKKRGEQFELVDGQQRLTTLYLIYKYMNFASGGFIEPPKFTLSYETREKSAEFLETMDVSMKGENIDFWFLCNAYETIGEWFASKGTKSVVMGNVNRFFAEHVKIIWYEADGSEDSIGLFTRLNIGKIALTSAELVKAMFLSKDSRGLGLRLQEEIALQWDAMEQELHKDGFWYFLANQTKTSYQTRIDLILDLVSQKPEGNRSVYYTFFELDRLRKEKGLGALWQEIRHTYLALKDWYGDHGLYHKAGYLIASNAAKLSELYEASKGATKHGFVEKLDGFIRESIRIEENYADLSYEEPGEYQKISRLLLLFNVESVRKNGAHTGWFPFDKHKRHAAWSLEHIHAQHAEGMNKQEEWREWLSSHRDSIAAFGGENSGFLAELDKLLHKRKLEKREFLAAQEKVVEKLSAKRGEDYLHSIGNLALLDCGGNAALSNSTFAVKRNKIIAMDQRGEYIPFCTKMVFLKYYSPSEGNQLHFWGQEDRKAYIEAMNRVLGKYLDSEISKEQEG